MQAENTNNEEPEDQQSVLLQNIQGFTVGSIIQWDNTNNRLLVINKNNYMFQLTPQGLLSSPLPTRFYLSADCDGSTWSESFTGMDYKHSDNALWYTPKQQTAQQAKPISAKSSDDICTQYAGSELTLVIVI